jgi:NAD(P)-dependent dehydrogenase (short-subunit alcohol dehydrogenase family)
VGAAGYACIEQGLTQPANTFQIASFLSPIGTYEFALCEGFGGRSDQRYHFRAGVRSTPDLYDSAQTKAATMIYVKSLAKQLGLRGIRVNGVAPGPVWTPLQVSGGASMEKLEQIGSQTVFKRPGQPAELASIYVQLAAEAASCATGAIYGSSGGGQPLALAGTNLPAQCI